MRANVLMKDLTPRAYRPLLEPARYKGAFGGRCSGKSNFIAAYIIDRCITYHTRVVCVREVQTSLSQSVKILLEDVIDRMDVSRLFRVTNTYIETPCGGIITFHGMEKQTSDSIKSLESFDICWCEEAQLLSERSLTMLRSTLRKEGSEFLFTWNPHKETDPVDVLLRSKIPLPLSLVVRTDYRDNPWFPEVMRQEMEWDRSRDPEKYAHIWLGDYLSKSQRINRLRHSH